MESSDIRAVTTPNKRIGQALRNLLCGARPYVFIGWLWAICFYCVALGHMFLLVGCARGARPYVRGEGRVRKYLPLRVFSSGTVQIPAPTGMHLDSFKSIIGTSPTLPPPLPLP